MASTERVSKVTFSTQPSLKMDMFFCKMSLVGWTTSVCAALVTWNHSTIRVGQTQFNGGPELTFCKIKGIQPKYNTKNLQRKTLIQGYKICSKGD